MKKIYKTLLFVLLVSLLLSTTAFAGDSGARLNYVTDEAGLLSAPESAMLNAAAAEISAEFGCSVYIITVDDYTDYTNGDIYTCATEIYNYYELGYGSDKNGLLLILSMADRDYSLIAHGSLGNAAFTDYGKELISDNFLDDFRGNDWLGGFEDYLDWAEYMLEENAKGSPVDIRQSSGTGSSALNILLIIAVPCLAALLVCTVFKAQMKTAKIKTTAGDYVENGGIDLRVRQDVFMHRTQTRQIIQQQNRSGGGGHGGTTVRSGGFSGRSGKF